MNKSRLLCIILSVCVLGPLTTGCPNGVVGTFDLYIINGMNERTVGLVGVDNHVDSGKEFIDVLDENIPAGSMKVLHLSQAVYGDESGGVEIGVVNVGFESINGVALGPDPVAILVKDNGNEVALQIINFQ